MKWCSIACFVLICGSASLAAELPGHYYKVMADELKPLHEVKNRKSYPGAMLAAAVLHTQKHPNNRFYKDKQKLELALALGDLYAGQSEKDTAENLQHHEWDIHFWLDTYRLLKDQLGPARSRRWRKEIDKIVKWFAGQTKARIDFPRYQGPYIRTSTNHLALFASTVYLAGRVLQNKEWETLGTRAMHRLAAEEQTADGYWAEFTDNGPTTGYNYVTMTCVALYWEHSRDTAAHEALRRAATFHKHFTWPDGTPVETINGRNRHWPVSAWGHFGFSHWPDGRRYAEFLAGYFAAGKLSSRDLGRLAQNALYFHEGPTEPIPMEKPRFAYQMRVPAGIRKSGPWLVCLSGLIDAPIESRFTLDRQGHISIYHQELGMVVTGANSKHQPELATFRSKRKGRIVTIPLSSRLRMSDRRDRLALAYPTFFADLTIPAPKADGVALHFAITETGRGRLEEAHLNFQLRLHPGEVLQTAKSKLVLSDKRVELGPNQIGGWISHHGWKMRVENSSRLTWPVFPFNPYRNGPEKDLQHAVAVLSVPVDVQPPPKGSPLNWRRQRMTFALEAEPVTK